VKPAPTRLPMSPPEAPPTPAPASAAITGPAASAPRPGRNRPAATVNPAASAPTAPPMAELIPAPSAALVPCSIAKCLLLATSVTRRLISSLVNPVRWRPSMAALASSTEA
jgi:hypothetical protein